MCVGLSLEGVGAGKSDFGATVETVLRLLVRASSISMFFSSRKDFTVADLDLSLLVDLDSQPPHDIQTSLYFCFTFPHSEKWKV